MNTLTRTLGVLLCLLPLALTGCITEVGIQGAPCPCPSGYDCCRSLSVCLLDGQDCPERLPASSAEACTKDADCPRNETCQAWLDAQGLLAGPGQCRHDCVDKEFPCAQGEVCEPVPSDGRSLSEMHVAWVCVSEESLQECTENDCRQCEQVGGTFCDDEHGSVMGCFLSVHPVCGLSCTVVPVEVCSYEGSVCELVEGGAHCTISEYDGDICGSYPCSDCPAQPGSLYCRDDDLSTCATVSVAPMMCADAECSCSEACIPLSVLSCVESCSMLGGAHCLP